MKKQIYIKKIRSLGQRNGNKCAECEIHIYKMGQKIFWRCALSRKDELGWKRPEGNRAIFLVCRKVLKIRDIRLWNNLYREDTKILLLTTFTLNLRIYSL